jgi:hypothetical protein
MIPKQKPTQDMTAFLNLYKELKPYKDTSSHILIQTTTPILETTASIIPLRNIKHGFSFHSTLNNFHAFLVSASIVHKATFSDSTARMSEW